MAQVPLAVVGMACRLPGAADVSSLWRNVLTDTCAIRALPPERFHKERYYDPEIGAYGKSYSAIGGVVEDGKFDPTGLGLEGEDLAGVDRAHLWALDVARTTIADSGFDEGSLAARRVGVVIGRLRGGCGRALGRSGAGGPVRLSPQCVGATRPDPRRVRRRRRA